MICKIKETVEKYSMFSKKQSVTVGVSGGADSCALLWALCKLQDEYNLDITAAHVNHGIRGEEALRDERFVEAFCKKLGVKLEIAHFDVPKMAKEKGLGLEECGRILRYEFFESINPDSLIATAHNLSDCCETLLINITRGTSPKGLASIPAVRRNIIRPLINCTRAEIEAFCKENKIGYVTDSTNNDDIYTRNKIRLNVIPQLKEINPSFEQAAARLIENVSEDNDYFSIITKDIIERAKCDGGYNASVIAENHKSIKSRVVASLIEKETGIVPENKHISAVCDILSGGKTQILGAVTVTVKNGVLSFGEKELTPPWSVEINSEACVNTPDKTVYFEIIHNFSFENIQFVHKDVLDYNSIVGKLVLRSRREGDEIKIAGRNCTKKIKKMLTEEKIEDKNSVCVLADDSGPVWVEGFGCAERCKITNNTPTVLKITVVKDVPNGK